MLVSDNEDGAFSFGFRLNAYDQSKILVIAPATIIYCGFIGGANTDHGRDIAVDAEGNAYVTGFTSSPPVLTAGVSFPVKVWPDVTCNSAGCPNCSDAFVAKVKSDVTLVYCGFIGGLGDDYAFDVAVDSLGNAYTVGHSFTSDGTFPVKVGPDLTFNWNGGPLGGEAFVVKVAP